jgi:hypothetical protein
MPQPTNILFFLLFILLGTATLNAQDLPKVFLIGENEEGYEKMLGKYPELLLNVSDNSMDKAYNHWIDLLSTIEDYANEIGYDIKGVKIWLNVFWDKNGAIDYLVYYPKPNSRNIDFDAFTGFLDTFLGTYQLDIKTKKNFSHYGSASFPVFGKRSADKG